MNFVLESKELQNSTEIAEIKTTSKKKDNKLYQTTSKITIKPANQDDWQPKSLKCECKNELTILQSLDMFDKKSISINCNKNQIYLLFFEDF